MTAERSEEIPLRPPVRLAQEDLDALLRCGRRVEFATDDVLLEQGKENSALCVLREGTLHVWHRNTGGLDVLLGRVEPGGIFGEISLFDPGPTTASVVAVSPGHLVRIESDDLQRFTDDHPRAAALFLRELLQQVGRRMRRTDERLVQAIFWSGVIR